VARTKKHHYLPQSYLRGFATESNPDQIWRVEKSAEAKSHLVSIKDAGEKNDYHTFDRSGGHKDSSSVEQGLSKLEGIHSATIARILRKESFTPDDRGNISSFVSLMRVRVPSFKKCIEDQYISTAKVIGSMLAKGRRFEEVIQKYRIPIMEDVPEDVRADIFGRMRKMIIEDRYSIEISNTELLRSMFTLAFDRATIFSLNGMRVSVWDVPAGLSLITCDQPVALFQPQSGEMIAPAGLLDPHTVLSMSLSSRCAIRLDWRKGDGERGTLSATQVEEINRRTIVMAHSAVYAASPDEVIKNSIRANHNLRAGFKSQVIRMPGQDGAYVLVGCMPVLPPEPSE
jgi:hypothetical protein